MKTDGVMWVLIGCTGLLLLVAFIEFGFAAPETKTVRVVGKSYQSAQTHVGTGSDSKGNSTTVVTATPEKYTLIISYDGRTWSHTVDAATYGVAVEGSNMRLKLYRGCLTGKLR